MDSHQSQAAPCQKHQRGLLGDTPEAKRGPAGPSGPRPGRGRPAGSTPKTPKNGELRYRAG